MAPTNVRNGVNVASPSPATLDPRVLLNPKAYKVARDVKSKEPANPYSQSDDASRLFKPSSSRTSSLPVASEEPHALDGQNGQASLIERMHNVERREDRPVKKQKTQPSSEVDDEDASDIKKKSKSDHVGGSGDMGEYLKEKRRDALEKQGPPQPSDVVDLTGDNDNATESDELMVMSDSTTQEVCLGRIDGARVNAHKVPQPKPGSAFAGSQKHWPPMKCTLQRRPGPNNIIAVADPMGHDFGNLDFRVASALVPIMDGTHVTKLRVQARLDSREKKGYDYPGQPVSDNYPITLNLYAPRKYSHGIGKFLSQRQVWLREPLGTDHGVPIFNPHAPKDHAPAQKAVLAKLSSKSSGIIITRTQEEVKQDILGLFDSLQETKDIPSAEAPSEVITDLLPHQKQAVYFMRKRELLPVEEEDGGGEGAESEQFGSIWKENIRGDRRKTWVNVITGHEVRHKPSPSLGGILADVMGLGKTLNLLSLIVGSLSEARAWAQGHPSEQDKVDNPAVELNSSCTLLLCPLSTIVNWEDQIKTHLKPGTLKYCIYQGTNRTNDPYKLRQYDLVITTYPTVAADINTNRKSRTRPNSPLFEINWFRIVLDEAHTIRKQSTIQCRAACTLSASRRWCVTGTPVQNRLDDLGALIRFLRIKPFDESGNFSTFISTPLRTGDGGAIPKLRLLVDSITLRRLKDKIDLPDRREEIVKLPMSDEERKLYDFFATEAYKNIEAMAGKNKTLGGKSYAHVLRVIGRLRMLCVHGSDMLSGEDWDRIKGWDPSNAIDLEDEDDERPDRPLSQVFEMYRMMKDAMVHFCVKCNKFITPEESEDEDEESIDESTDDVIGYLTSCNHMVCPDCIDKYREQMKKRAGVDNYGTCVTCQNYIRVTFFPIKQSELREDEKAQEELRKSRFAKNLTRYSGPSTKVQALLDELRENERVSEANPDELPVKSVVFSEWVTLLDLIQLAFTAKNISFARLDGKMSFSQRQQSIKSFMTSTDVNVIIVSLKAGGLGLNLTAASRVYTMEPNYNPAAEAQAVERVHRLGQTREVVIKRYVMQDSIEEKVLKLQDKKLQLAEFSVEREHGKNMMSKDDVARQKLEDLKLLLR